MYLINEYIMIVPSASLSKLFKYYNKNKTSEAHEVCTEFQIKLHSIKLHSETQVSGRQGMSGPRTTYRASEGKRSQ